MELKNQIKIMKTRSQKNVIANLKLGLLEKGTNKRQQSYIFNSLDEGCSLQVDKGGNTSVITRYSIVMKTNFHHHQRLTQIQSRDETDDDENDDDGKKE